MHTEQAMWWELHPAVATPASALSVRRWHGSFLEVQTYWSKRLRWTRIQRMPGLTGCAVSLYRKQSRILYGVETTAAFQLLELTHVSRDNPGQSVQQLLAAAGLAQPDQILYDAALAWVLSALIGIPELLLLLCAGCRLLRLFRNKSLRESYRARDCTAACLLTSDLFGFAARMDDSQSMGKYGGVAFAFVCRR